MNNQYTIKKLRGYRKVGEVVDKVTKPAFGNKGHIHQQLYGNWVEIVGDNIASKAFPKRVTFPRGQKNNGILHIEIYGADMLEVAYQEGLIIEKLAIFFGYKAIEKIKIHQKPMDIQQDRQIVHKKLATSSDNHKIYDSIEKLEDSPMKDALKSLGGSVKKDIK